MGLDVFALVTDWGEMVAAYRAAGGFEFYWDANLKGAEPIPFVAKHLPVGQYYPHSRWYYHHLRSHLPVELRTAADGFLLTIYPLDNSPLHDLAVDAGVAHHSGLPYAMRPAAVHTALKRDALVPWEKLAAVADRVEAEVANEWIADFGFFEAVVARQRQWLSEAAATQRGIVLVVSQ